MDQHETCADSTAEDNLLLITVNSTLSTHQISKPSTKSDRRSVGRTPD